MTAEEYLFDNETEEALRVLHDKFNDISYKTDYFLDRFGNKHETDNEKSKKLLFSWWLTKLMDRCIT